MDTHIYKLAKWADKNLMKFNEGKPKSCTWGGT